MSMVMLMFCFILLGLSPVSRVRARHESFGIRHVAGFAPRLSHGHEVKASCAHAMVYSQAVPVELGAVLGVTFVGDSFGGHLR